MGVSEWLTTHWFDLLQSAGIIASLLFTAYTVRKAAQVTMIANLIALKQQHADIWRAFYEHPTLFRVLQKDPDLSAQPVSDEECLFVKLLLVHLDTVHRAVKAGMFVTVQGLSEDIRDFFSAPVPRAAWAKLKRFQSAEFVAFVEKAQGES